MAESGSRTPPARRPGSSRLVFWIVLVAGGFLIIAAGLAVGIAGSLLSRPSAAAPAAATHDGPSEATTDPSPMDDATPINTTNPPSNDPDEMPYSKELEAVNAALEASPDDIDSRLKRALIYEN